MTGGASAAADSSDDSSLDLPSSNELGPADYAVAVDEALWGVSERLISRKHPSPESLKKLQSGLAALSKFVRQIIYPREADAELNELIRTFQARGDDLLGMLGGTLSSLNDYIETLEELGPSGTIAIESPADLDASIDAKGKKRDAFIKELDQLQLWFQQTVKPLRLERSSTGARPGTATGAPDAATDV
jgi:hypothetical protein